jgi:hypothetical protein
VELVELCKGYPIVRHPQKTLLGFAIESRMVGSFIDCVEQCFTQRQLSNRVPQSRKCKSVVFFYEVGFQSDGVGAWDWDWDWLKLTLKLGLGLGLKIKIKLKLKLKLIP